MDLEIQLEQNYHEFNESTNAHNIPYNSNASQYEIIIISTTSTFKSKTNYTHTDNKNTEEK